LLKENIIKAKKTFYLFIYDVFDFKKEFKQMIIINQLFKCLLIITLPLARI